MGTADQIAQALARTGFPVRVTGAAGAGIAVDTDDADRVLVAWESGRRGWEPASHLTPEIVSAALVYC